MRIPLLILFLLSLSARIWSQQTLPESDPIHQKVEKVYKQLCQASGDFRRSLPRLVVMERSTRVASYRSSDNTLILERKAYEVCASFGKDCESALAFLLGHELTHFYQEHDWSESGFGTTFLAESTLFSAHAHQEEEADTYGAFMAYLAGYNSLKIIPLLLDKLYQSYRLDVNMANYPSLPQRKSVAEKVQNRVAELIKVYDNANYFAALGWQIQAVKCYEYLLKFVKTKELYNNLGMAILSMALQQQTSPYWYPLEIELEDILRQQHEKPIATLLAEAEKNLKAALVFDASYVAAHNNLAVLYQLQKRSAEAQAALKKADMYAVSVTDKAKIAIIAGIILAQNQEKEAAEKEFQKAYNYSINGSLRQVASHNLAILQNQKTVATPEKMTVAEDMLDRVPLFDSPPSKFDQNLRLSSGLLAAAELHFSHYPNSELACLEQANSAEQFNNYFVLHRTRKLMSKKGIRIGDAASTLRKAYDPVQIPRTVQYKDGYFLIYRTVGLIFKINKEERVEEWGLFLNY